MPNKWALLIGVDFYFQGSQRDIHFKNLKGCVRDVSRIEEHLESIGGFNIEKLTASSGVNDEGPMETNPDTWPTYDNIKAKIDYISSRVAPGDFVHIHYSGHGILRHRLKDLAHLDGGDAISGTALVPTDVKIGGAYLSGYQLGVWVRRLVENHKVRVSITLDSCYSGKGLREENDPNFALRTSEDSEFDDSWLESDEKGNNEILDIGIELDNDTDSDERNATVKKSWLSSSEGCTVLTACQIGETAGEYKFVGQPGKSGILTHWMLDTISRWPRTRILTYTQVVHHVKTSITTEMTDRTQTPTLHGDSFYEFFGNQRLIQLPMCSVRSLEQPGSQQMLYSIDIGTAQGVAAGAIYSVLPIHPKENKDLKSRDLQSRDLQNRDLKIRVCKASIFHSEATLIHADRASQKIAIGTGSLAVRDTWALPSGRPLNNFTASLNYDTNSFEIKDAQHERVARVPAISVLDDRAGVKIAYMLKHLERFSAVADFSYGEPPNLLDPQSYTFELLDDQGTALIPLGNEYEVRNGQDLTIRFVNNDTTAKNVHVAIFLFSATWGIQRCYPEDGQSTIQAMPDDKALTCDIRMSIPRAVHDTDPPDIRDRFRAYIYRGDQPPSWDELLLPDIPAHAGSVPEVLVVEPLPEEEDEEDGSRNIKKPSRGTKPRVQNEKEESWQVKDFWVHTTP